MKIKSKFRLNTATSLFMVLIIGLSLFHTNNQVDRAVEKSAAMDEITQNAFELNLLTSDYLLHQQIRAYRQWHIVNDLLSKRLGDSLFSAPEEQQLVAQMLQGHDRSAKIFARIARVFSEQKTVGQSPSQYSALQERLISQLISISQVMLAKSKRLSEISKQEVLAAQSQASLVVMVLILVSAMVVAINSLLLGKSIIQPLAKLQKGSQLIGNGDLDHKIGLVSPDELGDLSESFDQMSANLKKVTVNKAVLEKEIITRKQVESELLLNKEILDHMSEGVYLTTKSDGIIRYTNPVFEQLFGYAQGELLEQHVEILNAPTQGNDESSAQQMKDALSRYGAFSGEVETVKKDHSVFWSQLTISDFQHHLLGDVWVCLINDITEHKKLENYFQQSSKMEALGTLAGGIAHDFNNILAAIFGNAELTLKTLPPDAKARKNIESIYNSGERAAAIVRQILTFSRMEVTRLEPVDLVASLPKMLGMVKAAIPTNIQIKESIQPLYSAVKADTTQIQQILLNLCTNAYHAMEDGVGTIEISLSEVDALPSGLEGQKGRHLKLSVSDTGCGIDPANLTRIYDPFYTTKEVGKGTGLGLSVVHGIVEQHEGKIDIKSQPGSGTVVAIYLPTTELQVDQQEITQSSYYPCATNKDPTSSHRADILIVEDEQKIAQLYQRFLQDYKYRVTVCANGKAALELFKADPDKFDLILTDQAMPLMTGEQLAMELLKIRPELPVIMSTGYSEVIGKEKAYALGIRQYLMKPLKLPQLLKAIEQTLSN